MKRILSVQDLSCVGRCSLTVALPILSAMGHSCSVLPTAVLSTHTGFAEPFVKDMTGELIPMAEHWKAQGISFDAASIGYLSDPAQAEAVQKALEGLTETVILDPAMADHGKLYSRMTADHVKAMRKLCRKAEVLLPNVTEAALLAEVSYEEACRDPATLLEKLTELGPRKVLITGVTEADSVGFVGIEDGRRFRYMTPSVPRKLHGTGDMFTAVFTGAYTEGRSCEEAGVLAARFVERTVKATKEVTPFGGEFEKQLPWLWEQMK